LIRLPVELDLIVEAVAAKVFNVEREFVVEKRPGKREKNISRRVAMRQITRITRTDTVKNSKYTFPKPVGSRKLI